MRTYVIERQAVFVPYLEALLTAVGLEIVGVAGTVDVPALGAAAPAAVFVDIDYLARGGLTALCTVAAAVRGAKVIAFTEVDDSLFAASCVVSGATAVCSKSHSEEAMRAALLAATAR